MTLIDQMRELLHDAYAAGKTPLRWHMTDAALVQLHKVYDDHLVLPDPRDPTNDWAGLLIETGTPPDGKDVVLICADQD